MASHPNPFRLAAVRRTGAGVMDKPRIMAGFEDTRGNPIEIDQAWTTPSGER